MYGMDVHPWNEDEINRLEVGQNVVARMALNAPRYTAVEALRGDMGWSSFLERFRKACLRYKIRLEFLEDTRIAKKVYMWNRVHGKWDKKCIKIVNKCGLTIGPSSSMNEEGRVCGWVIKFRNEEGIEGNLEKSKKMIDTYVKNKGRMEWNNAMENKSSLVWYKRKTTPKFESWYDGSLGGDLLFRARARALDVNARNYRWSDSGEKKCLKCAANVDETVEHVVLECPFYTRERDEMWETLRGEPGCMELRNMRMEGMEAMVYILGLNGGCPKSGIDAVKRYLEKMWGKRNGNR